MKEYIQDNQVLVSDLLDASPLDGWPEAILRAQENSLDFLLELERLEALGNVDHQLCTIV